MNCQELTELLDNGDIRNIPLAKRCELDAHLSGCAACAAEWRVQERIALTPAMWVPVGFVAQCRQLVAAGASRLFVPRRVILYSTLLVLAAAAALLALRQETPLAEPAAVVAVPAIAAPAPAPLQVQPEAEPVLQPAAAPVKPPAGVFTVNLLPLQIEGNDAEGNGLAALFHNRVAALLQNVPNLVLVDAPPASGAAEYELRMSYTAANQPMPYSRSIKLEVGKSAEFAATEAAIAAEAGMNPADQQRSRVERQMAGIEKQMATMRSGNTGLTLVLGRGVPTVALIYDRSSPDGVEPAAQRWVRDLRIFLFPLDESFEQAELATLRNPSLQQAQRMRALGALLSYAERRGGFSHASPAVVRAGGEFALAAENEMALRRAAVWDALALTGSPELVPYLVRGLDESARTETRLQLVRILSEQYGDDPRAHAALAAAAKSNDQQTVRMAAVRGSDDAGWREYVAATLGNSNLPDLQRLQPIADMAPGEMGALSTSPKTKMVLEPQQLRELGVVLARIAPDSTASEVARKALFAAGAMETPAALDMLVELLEALDQQSVLRGLEGVSIMGMQQTARSLIGYRYAGNPKARAVIEKFINSPDTGLADRALAEIQLRSMDAKANMEKLRSQQPTQ